jgi:hypothetical protein
LVSQINLFKGRIGWTWKGLTPIFIVYRNVAGLRKKKKND